MIKDEYTKRLEEILFDIANYAVQLPRQYPNHNYEPSDGIISGNVALFIAEYNEQAKQAIKQLMVDEVKKARIDELERLRNDVGLFPSSYGRDDDKWQERNRTHTLIDRRLAELQSTQPSNTEDKK